MSGATKILTVSYGTFSCTLEGFDDPFSTMKAIAEYFRDLAADDRYFGAEPPTPDAALLHRSAERELSRKVEARVSDGTVVLRQAEPEASPAPAVAPAVAPVEAPPAAEDSPAQRPTPNRVFVSAAAAVTEAVAEPVVEAVAELAAEPAAEPALEAAIAEAVAEPEVIEVAQVAEAEPVVEPVAEIAPEPVAEVEAEAVPVAEVAEEPVAVEETPEVVAETVAEPEPASELVAEPGIEPEIAAEPAPEPVAAVEEAIAEPAPEPVAEPEPVTEAEAATAPAADDAVVIDHILSLSAEAADWEEDQPADVALADDAGAADLPDSSVAARLQRIRAVVESVRATPQADEEESYDEDVTSARAPWSEGAEDFGFVIDMKHDLPALDAAEAERAAKRTEEAAERLAASDLSAEDEPQEEPSALAAIIAAHHAAKADAEPEAEEEEAWLDDLAVSLDAADEPQAEIAEEPAPSYPVADPVAEAMAADRLDLSAYAVTATEVEAEPARAAPAAEEPAVEATAEPAPLSSDDEDFFAVLRAEAEQADATGAAPVAPVAEEDEAPAPEDSALLSQLSALGAEVDEHLAAAPAPAQTSAPAPTPVSAQDEPEEWDEAEAETESADTAPEPHLSLLQRARAGMARLSKSVTGTPEVAEAAPAVEETLAEDIATPDGSWSDVTPETAEDLPQDDDPDVTRLMAEAKTKLEGAENRRRFSAISHLKAAVAATLADRKMHADAPDPVEPEATPIDLYREDLSKVVRPRRPTMGDTATPRPTLEQRPAPLVLVSEQRVDRPEGAEELSAIRPRRVWANTAAFAEDEEEDLDDLGELTPEDASSFADFAEKLGAVSLTDLLEAAAVYTASVEGRESFTRPHLLRKVEFVSSRGEFNREDGMRSFGMLLRQGKLQKVSRGQFTVTESSRFMSDARKAM